MSSAAETGAKLPDNDPYVTAERNIWTDPPPGWGQKSECRAPREGGMDARGYGPKEAEVQELLEKIKRIGAMRKGANDDLTMDEQNVARFAFTALCNWTMNNDIAADLCKFPGLSKAIEPYAYDTRYKAQVVPLLARLGRKEYQTQIEEVLWLPAAERNLM